MIYLDSPDLTIYVGDVREQLAAIADASIDCVVTSPPYGLATLAYLGGILDGEGYIGIKKTSRLPRPIYHERIQVRMVHEPAIALLASALGGNYYREKPHANNGRPLFCWQASDLLAARIAATLLPYLVVKRESALNLLLLRASKNDPRARMRGGPTARLMPTEIFEERERLYARAKLLNGRGGDALYGAVPGQP